jgi:hypothetical protein
MDVQLFGMREAWLGSSICAHVFDDYSEELLMEDSVFQAAPVHEYSKGS